MQKALFIIFFSIPAFLHAQKSSSKKTRPGIVSIRLNPSGIINLLDFNLSGGVEYHLTKDWSLGMDAGWIFGSIYFSSTLQANGRILRPSIRRYWKKDQSLYTEAILHYKKVIYTREGWVERKASNGLPAYEEFTIYDVTKRVIGPQINVGGKSIITYNKKLWVEYFLGFGVRRKTTSSNETLGTRDSDQFFSLRKSINKTARRIPALPAGVRLIYTF